MQTKANNKKSLTMRYSINDDLYHTYKNPYRIDEVVRMIDGLTLDVFVDIFTGRGEFKRDKINEGINEGNYTFEVEISDDNSVTKRLRVTEYGLHNICYKMNMYAVDVQIFREVSPIILN